MQKESQRDKELRIARREYLRKLDEKLNEEEPKTNKKRKAIIEPVEKGEVVSVNEASNEDALFSEEE